VIHLTIRQRILLGLGILMAAMVAMGGFAYVRLAGIEQQAALVQTNSLPALFYSSQIFIKWQENYALTPSLINQANTEGVRSVQDSIEKSRQELDDLLAKYTATMLSTRDSQYFASLASIKVPYEGLQKQIAQLGLAMTAPPVEGAMVTPASIMQLQAKPLLRLLASQFNLIHTAVELLDSTSKANADKAANEILTSVSWAKTGILVCFGAAFGLAILTGFFLLRAVTRPLGGLVSALDRMREGDFTRRVNRRDEFGALGDSFNQMADELSGLFGQVQKSGIQVGASVTQIAATAKQQQATATEIAATTTEIGATSKEISATSKELVKTMNEVSRVAEQTASLAGNGQSGLSRMEETMHHVMDAAGSINAKLAVLNEKAGNINQVVTTITKVADQTNLLSLNAAIEAEKAGEYGRGFTVVASEIRRLADQTAVATYDIEQMVKEIQSAVSAGVMGMDKFSEEVRHGMQEVQQVGGQLSQIISQVQALVPRFENVNEAMQAQATGAEQISDALLQLTESAQQTVESLRDSTTAIDDLNQVSGNLRGSVSRFKLETAA
jgi:methyl-accepting chemotaxis protein WspA